MSLDIHYTPGRIRVRCQSLLDWPHVAEEIRTSLSNLSGVRSVVYNERIGSMKIHFDQECLNPVVIFRQFQRQGALANVIPLPRFALRPKQVSPERARAEAGGDVDWSKVAGRIAMQLAIIALPLIAERYLGKGGRRFVSAIL